MVRTSSARTSGAEDPADEMVLDAAINGGADALVTHNVADFADAAKRFGLRIIAPGALLQELKE